MSDGGHQQRVLDLIDDPNALETFLGGLTSDSELLPSAESVDNVVASLARSLEADYEVDSPNETLFDSLVESSNNLTDISQSYVSSDFENAISNAGAQQTYNHSMGSMSNGEVNMHHGQQNMQNSLSTNIVTTEQFLMSSSQTNSNVSSNCTSSLQQFSSDCDSSSASQFLQQHIQLNQNQIMLESSNNNASYSISQEILQKQTIVNQNSQQQQTASLSSTSVNHLQTDSSISQSISVAVSNNQNNGQVTSHLFQQQSSNDMSQQRGLIQIVSQQQQQQVSNNSTLNSLNATSSITGSTSNNNNNHSNELSSTSVNNSNNTSSSSILQQPQYMQNATQQTTINQLVSAGQTVSLANVGGTQIIATSTGNIVTAGQTQANIIQQIQAAGGGQSFITVDQPTAALIAGQATFGGTNLALVSTGGTPTYAMVPSGAQFLSNAIMTQPQTIQTLTKGPNGTYYQTTGGAQLVATSNVSQIQNVNVSVANNSTPNKPKQPPQLLPKPQSSSIVNASGIASTDSDSSSGNAIVSSAQMSHSTNTVSASDGVVTQIFQQQQGIQGMNQVVVTSMGNTIIPQQSFAIGGTTGLGQMVLSQNPAQTQLTGTIVVNQYGQPMLVPTASTGQGGLQFIVRPQPQVLTLQTQAGLGGSGGKPVVRYVSQMPQLTQSSGYGLQQIQTANGPAWVAVRYPQQTTASVPTSQFNHIQADNLQSANVISGQIASAQSQIQVQTTQTQPSASPAPSNSSQGQSVSSQPSTPTRQSQTTTQLVTQDSTPDSSSGPPPAKKSKPRPKSNKKKVTLDLEQLLKQSGIMDEDLQDDNSFDFSFSSQDGPQNGFDSPAMQQSGDYGQLGRETLEDATLVQHPDVNTSGNKGKGGAAASKKKSGGGGGGSNKKRKSPDKKQPPTPPPPPSPAPTPKSKSKKKSGNHKAESKTESSKNDVPKKLSSLDDISATINAVAAAARTPSPPPPSPTPSISLDSPAQESTFGTTPSITPNSPATSNNSIKSAATMQTLLNSPTTPMSVPHNGYITNNAIASIPTSAPSGTTRIVQTIQLTPQNQQLLRNIQAQIARLLSLAKRNDTEQTALQKLIILQQQVIGTGIPVPNPSHLNNLAQNANINVPSTMLPASTFSATPVSTVGGTIPTGDSVISTNSSISNSSHSIASPSPQVIAPVTNHNSKLNTTVEITNNVATDDAENDLLESMVKLVNENTSSDSNVVVVGTTEENKENTTGGSLVASSSFSSGTNTTNAFGQHHVQSFPPTFRSTVDEKKTEEQRAANFKVEEEKRARWKKEEFEMLLKRDQQCVTQPDYEIPFTSKRDAVERLMKYHILRDRNDMNFEEFDQEFGEKSVVLLDKFNGMLAKYRSLLLKESMKEVGCAERVMLERMFVTEEKLKLEQDRLAVNQGEVLELPPPPSNWVPRIQDMVDKEMKEMEQDSYVSMQVQSAIDSIIGFGVADTINAMDDSENKIEYDSFGVPINSSSGGYSNGFSTSSADIDEAVRSILS